MNFLIKYRSSLLAVIIFSVFTIVSFGIYKTRSLEGDMDNHILAAEMFGVPAALKAHGVKPMFLGKEQTGWDGQFYYYMSNDILGRKDTATHMDSPSYRYQRIGLPLYVSAVATILGQDWVSPTVYIASYFFLILVATFAGGQLLARVGVNPIFVLIWALSVGTQITLFNALPDASADAFLIIALWLIFNGRILWSIVPFVLSGLAREVYVLFPSFIALFYVLKAMTGMRPAGVSRLRMGWVNLLADNRYLLLLPGIMAFAWRVYITRHFGRTPSSQAKGIIGAPFTAWIEYLRPSLLGQHPLVSSEFAYDEAGSLILFMLVLVAGVFVSLRLLKKQGWATTPEFGGTALAAICLAALYCCFGPTVMMHYSGYIKALAAFFFLIPLLLASGVQSRLLQGVVYVVLLCALGFTTYYNMLSRILVSLQNTEEFTQLRFLSDLPRVECFGTYEASVKTRSIRLFPTQADSLLFGGTDKVVVEVDLTNTGKYPFWSTRNFGSVFMSYQWIDANRKVLQDGIRSAIPGGLLPGQTKTVSVISPIPSDKNAKLVLSPVQEGCAWFYLANPAMTEGTSFQLD